MSSVRDSELPKLVAFPEFFDRLREEGALDAKGAIESETEIDGVIYHHRGVQVPAHEATFVWEPGGGERGMDDSDWEPGDDDPEPPDAGGEPGNGTGEVGPRFSLEVGAVGPRGVYAVFDATRNWDVFLVLFEGGAVVAWMSDDEFEAEEADDFPSKARAVEAGRFSFGAFYRFGPDWVEREEWALESTAPAMIQTGDGGLIAPETPAEFYENARAIPPELRPGDDEGAPDYLGLVDVGLSVN